MKIYKIALAVTVLALSNSANSVILNTLNGVDYEWLEVTETQGLSRVQVEVLLIDPKSALFGYQYASQNQMENLFLSYTAWDGIDGMHGAPDVVSGARLMINDFGSTYTNLTGGQDSSVAYTTVDGYSVYRNGDYDYIRGWYGAPDECGGFEYTCVSGIDVEFNAAGVDIMAYQKESYGWDAGSVSPWTVGTTSFHDYYGSFLVKEVTSVVPLPPAIWLFGSALLGLFGVAKRKQATIT